MKQISQIEQKKLMTEILSSIDAFCKKNDIKYFLAYGTLLGAIRHKGFIPWDDDIDICMPRSDYERFCNTYHHEYNKVVCPENDSSYRLWYAKVIDSRTEIQDRQNRDLGIFVDVFPIDGLGSNLEDGKVWYNKVAKLRYLYDALSCAPRLTFQRSRSLGWNTQLLFSKVVASILPLTFMRNKLVRMMKKHPYEESHNVAILCYGDSSWIMTKDVFSSAIDARFEGQAFAIPIGWEQWLSNRYGDYMTLPPVEQRVPGHILEAYWK